MVEPVPPHRESITGEVLNEPSGPSDAVGKRMPQVLLAVAYMGIALCCISMFPACRRSSTTTC